MRPCLMWFYIVDALVMLTSLPDANDLVAYGHWGPVLATVPRRLTGWCSQSWL